MAVMTEPSDEGMELAYSFYGGVVRKGPGSKASTLKALSMLTGLPPSPRIVDFGCGSGVASLALAEAMSCSITAVEIHPPFLDELEAAARRLGVTKQITTVQADMADPIRRYFKTELALPRRSRYGRPRGFDPSMH